MNLFKKFGIHSLLIAVGIAIPVVPYLVMTYLVMTTPGGKSPEQIALEKEPVATSKSPEMVSTTQLQMNRLEKNLQEAETNIQKLYKNQT